SSSDQGTFVATQARIRIGIAKRATASKRRVTSARSAMESVLRSRRIRAVPGLRRARAIAREPDLRQERRRLAGDLRERAAGGDRVRSVDLEAQHLQAELAPLALVLFLRLFLVRREPVACDELQRAQGNRLAVLDA